MMSKDLGSVALGRAYPDEGPSECIAIVYGDQQEGYEIRKGQRIPQEAPVQKSNKI